MLPKLGNGSGSGLVKAQIIYRSKGSMTDGGCTYMDVQFNPSEYSISRGLKVDKRVPSGKQGDDAGNQVASGDASVLKVSLYFDAYTDLKSASLKKMADAGLQTFQGSPTALLKEAGKTVFAETHSDVNERCEKFTDLVRFMCQKHAPPVIRFVWGDGLQFEGVVISSVANYTMFAPNGVPVRMKLDLEIMGEEVNNILEDESKPNESPDRTKERTMSIGDQLWMVAQDEYGDPAQWKEIARANDILNPRTVNRAMRLKVPSIR